jgi:hypothetical protein
MTTFTFATSGVHTPILLSAHAAYSASRTLVNAGVDQVVPFIVQRPDTPTQHDITALFPSYAAADAFADALRSEGLCTVSIADALRTNLAPDPLLVNATWSQQGSTGTLTHATTGGPNGHGYFEYVMDTANTASPMQIGIASSGTGGVPVTPGEPIIVSSYWWQSFNQNVQRYDAQWYDVNGTFLSGDLGEDEITPADPPESWYREFQAFTPPASAAFARPIITWSGIYTAPQMLRVADVLVEYGSQLRPWFAGDHSTGAAFDAAWTGPANASASVLVPKGVQVEQFDGISSSQVRVQNTPGTGATEVQFTLTEVPA